jgi:autotransporter translocation and assembly factor TamB
LNLNAEIPSNLWIKNEDIDAEFSGTINFIREKGVYRYIGSMEVLRGKGYMTGRTFRIEPGGIISYEDIEYPNPRLDITASTKIRSMASQEIGSETAPETIDLKVRVTGTLDEPIIEAAEGSPLRTEEIMPALFADYSASGNGQPDGWFENRVITGVTDFISTQMTQIGSRTLGVETFEIDPVYGDKFDPLGTRLTVGLYTHPNLYIYGRSAISGTAGQQVGFEYRLKRSLLIEGQADENDLYQLILHFYREF